MTLGYRFEFSIYSLIHAVLEKVGFTFAQTAAISFLLPICILLPISFNLFVLFIYYSTAATPPSFPRCILPGSNLFFSRITSSRRNFLLIIPTPLHTLCLSFLRPRGSCFTKRNTKYPMSQYTTKYFLGTVHVSPPPIMFLVCLFIGAFYELAWKQIL